MQRVRRSAQRDNNEQSDKENSVHERGGDANSFICVPLPPSACRRVPVLLGCCVCVCVRLTFCCPFFASFCAFRSATSSSAPMAPADLHASESAYALSSPQNLS